MPGTMIVRTSRSVLSFCNVKRLGRIERHLVRRNSTQPEHKVLERLNDKSIIRVSGKETADFLQGLITNDMRHFDEGAANIYCLFLNIKGRVMYDTIVYKSQESDTYYIECDSQAAEPLQKHLKMYRIRRKIDIEQVDHKVSVWTMFDPSEYSNKKVADKSEKNKLEGLIFPCGTLSNKASKFVDNIMIYEDPRLTDLGFRILAESKIERSTIVKHLNSDISESDEEAESYKAFRYRIGVGEGVQDLPPGKPLPLEINCDYLHGVSFHKGCYIGQELTARTYHTGVVRKRLMPLVFNEPVDSAFPYDEKITDESGKAVGKFRGNVKACGLGLMRITEALNAKQLAVSGVPVKVIKPIWWPQESLTQSVSADSRK